MVTISEIADRANVSKTTVSRVFNNTPGARISEKTRDRVMQVCEELGYQPNFSAQALANSRTFIIGAMFINISNPVIADFVEASEGVARKSGFHVILCNSRGDIEVEKNECQMLRQRGVEGLILEHAGAGGPVEHLIELDRAGFPLVLTGRNRVAPWIDYVRFDEVAGMYDATKAMIDSGRRNLVYLGYSSGFPACEDRLAGYRQALKDADILEKPGSVITVNNGTNLSDGIAAAKHLLEGPERPDGIICYTDYMAAGAHQVAASMGLRIPEDIAIMGYGDIPFGLMNEAPFPSVHLDFFQMGKEAANLLLDKIENKTDSMSMKKIDIRPCVVRRGLLG